MSTGAVRQQYRHNHIQPEALAWFERHFPPSTFHGRIQIGRRKKMMALAFKSYSLENESRFRNSFRKCMRARI